MSKIIDELKKEEGFSAHIYKCTRGFDSCGYGYNLQANPLKLDVQTLREARHVGVSEKQAEAWLMKLVDEIEVKLRHAFVCYSKLNEVRRNVLIQMAYQMGVAGLLKFKHAITAMEHGDYDMASICMLDSE